MRCSANRDPSFVWLEMGRVWLYPYRLQYRRSEPGPRYYSTGGRGSKCQCGRSSATERHGFVRRSPPAGHFVDQPTLLRRVSPCYVSNGDRQSIADSPRESTGLSSSSFVLRTIHWANSPRRRRDSRQDKLIATSSGTSCHCRCCLLYLATLPTAYPAPSQ